MYLFWYFNKKYHDIILSINNKTWKFLIDILDKEKTIKLLSSTE